MKKNKLFLGILALLLVCALTVGILAACASSAQAEQHYMAGVYQATKHGHHSDITVQVTVDSDSITDVKILQSGDTHHIGDRKSVV
jgi:fumarate reductase flavoprotein subunit